MTKDEAVEAFDTQVKLAEALGITQGSVAGWGTYPPALRQLQIEALTAGKLKAEPDCDKFRVRPAPAHETAAVSEAKAAA
jgi:transcriptional repressor of cell division inhibition gene dicB